MGERVETKRARERVASRVCLSLGFCIDFVHAWEIAVYGDDDDDDR